MTSAEIKTFYSLHFIKITLGWETNPLVQYVHYKVLHIETYLGAKKLFDFVAN